ncbi:cytochrome-c peroxidase [Catalinimonas niigatensis]|uniref:cytochrome-c peroxidase n=1 Tax=Catalinimonas niigatensis TaxID=1397264 RepID=UPI002666E760|nr:cytochrome c peroxidase [Catalinimonas niigatensis]WPP52466.1 cytochrome c peroxidase [Catalinimonas niigatensis]
MKTRSYSYFFFLVWLGVACGKKQEVLEPTPYTLSIPANLQKAMPIPRHNPMTEEGVVLGKKLFYDPLLSANNQISCATCHVAALSFSDGKTLSNAGLSKKTFVRHVPHLTNVGWSEGLFWDGGANNLESMVFGPLTHPDEMGEDLEQLLQELQQMPDYPHLFRKAYGTDSIQSALVARALAQYMRTLISADSRYDRFVRSEEGGSLSAIEREGLNLFKEKCASCHAFESGKKDFFTDFSYHNNGLDTIFSEEEERVSMGRFRISFDSTQIGAYKTPTLRNVALTAPYMHDGRFQSLKEVLDHYNQNMLASPYLDTALQNSNGQVGIPMQEGEKEAIIAFLHTLSDQDFSLVHP